MTSKALIVIAILLLSLSFGVYAQIPAAPGNLKAVAESDTEIVLTWNDNSSNEDLFVVERSVINQNDFSIVATVARNNTTFTDEFAAPKTKYFYRVKARDITFFGNRDSGYSNIANATTPGPPSPPSGLNASTLSKTAIEVTWNEGSDDTEAYSIERSENSDDNFTFVTNIGADKKKYVDDGLNSNTRYHYRVRGLNEYGNSDFSNKDSDVTFQFPPTLDTIADPDPILENSGKQTIDLSGITAGSNESQSLTVTATSDNKGLIPNPSINYNSPDKTGSLSYTPVGGTFGSATITVTVEDSGPHNPPNNINIITRDFKVIVDRALPDFVIQNQVVPELVCLGESFQVTCDVKNQGSKQAPGSTLSIFFSVGDKEINDADILLADAPVPVIDKDETVPVAVDVTLEQEQGIGPYYIIFKIDHNNEIEEAKENNNAKNQAFNICLPDLSIENQNADQTVLSKGQNFNVSFDLINSGEIKAKTHKIKYYLARDQQTFGEEQVIGATTIAAVGAGETRSIQENLTIPTVTEDGNYFLVFRADSENDLIEKNEDNNIATINITIQNLPDLNITDVGIDPGLVAFGQTVSITATIINMGVESADPSVMKFYLSSDSLVSEGDLIFEPVAEIPGLAVGEQVNAEHFLDIPEAFEEGIYYIIAWADAEDVVWENNERNNAAAHEITILSDLPPVITGTDFPEYRVEGLDNTIIKVQAEDDVEIATVIFKYKGIRSTIWDSTTVNLKDGYYQVSIPGAIFDELGLEYYFEVFDDVGLKAVSETGFTHIEYSGDGLPFPGLSYGKNQSDYQMVAIPLDLSKNDIKDIFEDDLGPYDKTRWRLFTYENSAFSEYGEGVESPKQMEIGRGYWLIVRDEQKIFTGKGRTVKANQDQLFEITLNEGWNQIGNPYNFDFQWSDVLSKNGFPSGVSGDIKVFEGGFKSSDVLKSFQGGFVQANNSITLKIPIAKEEIPNGRMAGRTEKNSNGWYVGLTIGNGLYEHEINGFGMNELANDGIDPLDENHLPDFGFLSNLAIRFNSTRFEDRLIAKDIVSLKNEHIWNLEIENESVDQYVYLSWEIPDLDDPDKHLVLHNANNGVQVDMRTNAGIWIDSRNADDIKIIYGNTEFLKKSSIPSAVVLGGGYPNPFSQTTKIPLALPNAALPHDVYLRVYNNLGQNVKTLMKGKYQGGLYEVEWDGSNEVGDKVKPGIYFYQLQVANNDRNQSIHGRLVLE